ncbi:uncharacterized protein NECHADRAFT_22487, partial [Fusarium vanettenii 77-13-4]
IYVENPAWPLRDKQECLLFRSFIKHIAPIFDLCDHERHFTRIVPQRAVTCPPLLNAMLAAAAKYLNKFGDVDVPVGDEYLQKCLAVLIPALSCATAVVDENLLAAIVLLRFIEEIDVPFSSNGSQSHLIGTRVFLAAQKEVCEFTGLRLAAFWSALRQEIFTAVVHFKPVQLTELLTKITPFILPEDCNCSYANRTIIHCAACVQLCFGHSTVSQEQWDKLMDCLDQWWNARPWQFRPMTPADGERGSSSFPDEFYLNDAVVTGIQHYYLARLILLAHKPTLPSLGLARKKALDNVDDSIRDIVRHVCGIAEVNPMLRRIASLSIALAADRFIVREEQEALYEILKMANRKSPWTTQTIQEDVAELWNW